MQKQSTTQTTQLEKQLNTARKHWRKAFDGEEPSAREAVKSELMAAVSRIDEIAPSRDLRVIRLQAVAALAALGPDFGRLLTDGESRALRLVGDVVLGAASIGEDSHFPAPAAVAAQAVF